MNDYSPYYLCYVKEDRKIGIPTVERFGCNKHKGCFILIISYK